MGQGLANLTVPLKMFLWSSNSQDSLCRTYSQHSQYVQIDDRNNKRKKKYICIYICIYNIYIYIYICKKSVKVKLYENKENKDMKSI